MIKYVLFASLCLLLAACSSGNGPVTAGSSAADNIAAQLPPLPLGGGADLEPLEKVVSGGKIFYTFPGKSAIEISGNTTIDNQSAVLESGPGEIAWALYEVENFGSQSEAVDFLNSSVGEFWVALADYSTGRWEIHGPYTGDAPAISINDARYYSPLDNQFAALIAWNGSSVDADIIYSLVETPDMLPHAIESVGESGGLDIAELDGRPAVAFYDESNGQLRFAHAANAAPTNSIDWIVSPVLISGDPGQRSVKLLVVDGKPLLIYQTVEGQRLEVATALTESPAGESDWAANAVDDLRPCFKADAAVVNGRLIIAYYAEDIDGDEFEGNLGYILCAVSDTSDPLGSYSIHMIGEAGHLDTAPALAINEGPAVAFVETGGFGLNYAVSSAAVPTQSSDWTLLDTGLSANSVNLRLMRIYENTLTTIMFEDQLGEVKTASTTRALPAPDDWHIEDVANTLESTFDITERRQRPVVASLSVSEFGHSGAIRMYAKRTAEDPGFAVPRISPFFLRSGETAQLSNIQCAAVNGELGLVCHEFTAFSSTIRYVRVIFD